MYDGNETNVAIECVDIGYKFGLGFSGTYSWPNGDNGGQFGCDYYGCDISKLWEIDGTCTQPKLTINVLNMNYSQNTSIMIDINGDSNVIQCDVSNVTSDNCSDSRSWIT